MLEAYRVTVENPAAAYPTVAGRHPLRAFVQTYGKQTLMNAGIEAEYFGAVRTGRAEEHTSELQSLMRTSYAVLCLKHKIAKHKTTETHIIRTISEHKHTH